MSQALVIGAGPAGLMAAEELARAGHTVTVAEAKPSPSRKFLMAGKSGLNLTKAEPFETFMQAYGAAAQALLPMLSEFGPNDAQTWAKGLDQDIFTGSTGRVFPRAMKASPLLRSWLARLDTLGVALRRNWRWTGWQGDAAMFDTPDGAQQITADVTVLACGGASWARLGSDGAWARHFVQGALTPFAPANVGLCVDWSDHMQRHLGRAVKDVELRAGDLTSRGEFILSSKGLEGGGIYSVSAAIRSGAALEIDLMPGRSTDWIRAQLAMPRGKMSLGNHIRKRLKLSPEKQALLMEMARPLPGDIAPLIKALPIAHQGPRPLDEAISTAGGLRWDALDETLMIRARPGTYAAGEMLDWEAPTGGYLLTACLATGRWAGRAAIRWL